MAKWLVLVFGLCLVPLAVFAERPTKKEQVLADLKIVDEMIRGIDLSGLSNDVRQVAKTSTIPKMRQCAAFILKGITNDKAAAVCYRAHVEVEAISQLLKNGDAALRLLSADRALAHAFGNVDEEN